MKLRVAVVWGGPSSEASVSRASATAVVAALGEAGHSAHLVELHSEAAAGLAGHDVVFPVAHGPMGEDGCLQGLLEVLGLPFVGSGVLASALAANKVLAKRVFRDRGLPVAAEEVVHGESFPEPSAEAAHMEAVRGLRQRLGSAVVVKPVSGGSGIGVTPVRATDGDEVLGQALKAAFEVDPRVLVEALHQGLEVTCAVFECDGAPRAMPVTLILSKAAEWYDFQSRYAPGGSEHQCPAPFGEALTQRVQDLAVRAHMALDARDLSRADFVVNEKSGEVTLLELNTLPGMTSTSLFPEAVGVHGMGFADLCDVLVRRAHRRPPRFVPVVRAFPE